MNTATTFHGQGKAMIGKCRCGACYKVTPSARVNVRMGLDSLTFDGGRVGGAIPGDVSVAWVSCPCGKRAEVSQIVGTFNSAKVCNGRCMGSHGPACDCSCGGVNHGSSH